MQNMTCTETNLTREHVACPVYTVINMQTDALRACSNPQIGFFAMPRIRSALQGGSLPSASDC